MFLQFVFYLNETTNVVVSKSVKSVVSNEWRKFALNLNGYTERSNYEKLKREIDTKIKELENFIKNYDNANTNGNYLLFL